MLFRYVAAVHSRKGLDKLLFSTKADSLVKAMVEQRLSEALYYKIGV